MYRIKTHEKHFIESSDGISEAAYGVVGLVKSNLFQLLYNMVSAELILNSNLKIISNNELDEVSILWETEESYIDTILHEDARVEIREIGHGLKGN